jgi:uncharacterized protein YgiM (DUF1202 family)
MKNNIWLIFFCGVIFSSLITQPVRAAQAVRKPTAPVDELKTVPLVAGPATVVANHVNVRSRASLKGEIVTRMTNGEPVKVIEEVHLSRSAADEPSAWAKIVLPASASSWVNTKYIDPTTKTVNVKKLNVRAGPSEDYGIIGTLVKGDTVGEITTQGEWTKIETSPNFFAYMAAQYLKQEAPAPATPPPQITSANPPEPEPAPTLVTEPQPVAPPQTEVATVTPSPPANEMPVIAPAPEPGPAVEEPLPKRIVSHEGVVRGTVSIQAPTPYALVAPDTGVIVDYLYTPTPELDLSRYKGLRIVGTGEETLDRRWKNTPVITIQKIIVIE